MDGGVSGFWQATVDSLEDHIAVLDEDGVIVAVNAAWSRFAAANGGGDDLGVGADYFGVCGSAAIAGDAVAEDVLVGLRAVVGGSRASHELVYPCHSPEVERWFLLRATPLVGAGGASGVVASHRDVTDRHRASEQARFQARLLGGLDAAVIALDPAGRVVEWNKAAERQYGWSRDEALGRDARKMVIPAESRQEVAAATAALVAAGVWQGEVVVQRRDGSTFPVSAHNALVYGEDGSVEGMVGITTDLTERVESEQQMRGLRDFSQAVTNSVGEGLFVLDGDGVVSYINDTAVGLLSWPREKLASLRLHDLTHFRNTDGGARLFEECPITLARVEQRVIRVEDDIFVCSDGTQLPVAYTASPFQTEQGVAGSVVVFRDISVQKAEAERLRSEMEDVAWATRLRNALAEGGLRLYTQPIVSTSNGEQVSQELLLRLVANGKIVAPGAFLPAAERFGMMPQIDRWVVSQAIEEARHGSALTLNLSAGSLTDLDLLRTIEQQIEEAGIDPALLTFEVTETAIITDQSVAETFLRRLRVSGCKIALDDFGTGYGGFHYLKHLPIDYLKIDLEFVRDITSDPASRHVVEAIVTLARGFGHKTIAEGVEDQPTLDLLSTMGVDWAQGYLFGKPTPREARTRKAREDNAA